MSSMPVVMSNGANRKVLIEMTRKPIFMEVPKEVEGFFLRDRHVLCPNYNVCLDEAVSMNQYFDCGECLFRLNDIKSLG
jgi:hypothetical protein